MAELSPTDTFDLVIFAANSDSGFEEVYVWQTASEEGQNPTLVAFFTVEQVTGAFGFGTPDPSDSDVMEIMGRVEAGTCEIKFGYGLPGYTWREMIHSDWVIATRWPFRESKIHLFFEHLTERGSYVAPADGNPAEFHFPGLVKDQTPQPGVNTLTFWKRGTSLTVPTCSFDGDVGALIEGIEGQGWSRVIPGGYGQVNEFKVHYGWDVDGLPWYDPTIVIPWLGVTMDWAARLKKVALIYKAWEDGLTASDTGNRYADTKVWFKSWIGYAHELIESAADDISIEVFEIPPAVPLNRRTISGKANVLAWAIEHLEGWAETGVDQWRTLRDAVVQEGIADADLMHVQADGTRGEFRVGSIESDVWSRYQVASYNAVIG